MMKPDRRKKSLATIVEAWDAYGHAIPFDDLLDMKIAKTHGYVAVCWDAGKDIHGVPLVDWADLGFNGAEWEMLNDGHPPVTRKVWDKAKVVPHCDELDIREEDWA